MHVLLKDALQKTCVVAQKHIFDLRSMMLNAMRGKGMIPKTTRHTYNKLYLFMPVVLAYLYTILRTYMNLVEMIGSEIMLKI